MKELAHKILNTTVWNVGAAGINFITNYFIVTWLSLSVFGEFTVYSSLVAIGTLIFSIIPSNYAIFRYQDDENFKILLNVFFLIAICLFTLYLYILNVLGLVYVSFVASLLYSLSLGLQTYFDITYQATNRLSFYFFSLFVIALAKLVTLFFVHLYGLLIDFESLLFYSSLPYIIIIVLLIYYERKNIIFKKYDVTGFFNYYQKNYKTFFPYYTNTFIKRFRENIIVFIFKPFVGYEVLGIYSLFVKIDQFVFGLSRNIEAFFMNRKNIQNFDKLFNDIFLRFSFLLQVVYIMVGCIYMKSMTNEFYWIAIIIQSFLVYPHVKFLRARASFLSNYNNKEANLSEISFILIVSVLFLIAYLLNNFTLNYLLLTYILAKLGLQLFLIFKENHIKNVSS